MSVREGAAAVAGREDAEIWPNKGTPTFASSSSRSSKRPVGSPRRVRLARSRLAISEIILGP